MFRKGVLVQPAADLDPAQVQHTERVRAVIAEQIAGAGGWISFERYMDLALYAPGLGYYSAGSRKLGGGGDFITAPEVSPLFGACVAKQCAEIQGDGGAGSILELGAGSGRLAVDVLTRLETLDRLPEQYLILDVSADLRERQRQLLADRVPHLLPRLEWVDAPPASFDGVIVANEVLDALPVSRFPCRGPACEELGVSCGERRLHLGGAAGRPGAPSVRARGLRPPPEAGRDSTSPNTARVCPPGPARSFEACGGAPSFGSTTGCRGRSTTCRRGATAP